jgi:hypothetical protein
MVPPIIFLLRRKLYYGFLSALKIDRPLPGLNLRILSLMTNTLPVDHRGRLCPQLKLLLRGYQWGMIIVTFAQFCVGNICCSFHAFALLRLKSVSRDWQDITQMVHKFTRRVQHNRICLEKFSSVSSLVTSVSRLSSETKSHPYNSQSEIHAAW